MSTITVPRTVRAAAIRAQAIFKAPAYATTWAKKLEAGELTMVEVERLHRFFLIQHALYEDDLERGDTTDVVAAWNLCGSDAARAWAHKTLRDARKDGYTVEDATVDLLKLSPDEIYHRLQLGAWKYEYGLDAKKAARFVEEYQLTRRGMLDLVKAFGDSAKSVSTALFRRFHQSDEPACIKAALRIDDSDYKAAAKLDALEISEGMARPIWSKPKLIMAQSVWPVLVAYAILAIEDPAKLKAVMKEQSVKPPTLNATPKPYMMYNDLVNIYRTYFHPQGSMYVEPTESFAGINMEVYDFVYRLYMHMPLQVAKVRKLLGRMRRWTAENKMAGGRFHIFNADWKKGNWQHILDYIPLDSDVRAAFSEFAAKAESPVGGIALQQTIKSKVSRMQIANQVIKSWDLTLTPEEVYAAMTAVPVDKTLAGKAAQALGTPFGVLGLIGLKAFPKVYIVAGAWEFNIDEIEDKYKAPTVVWCFPYENQPESPVLLLRDSFVADQLQKGEMVVMSGHKDLPHLATLNTKAAATEEPETHPASSDGGPIKLLSQVHEFLTNYQWRATVAQTLQTSHDIPNGHESELNDFGISNTKLAKKLKATQPDKPLSVGSIIRLGVSPDIQVLGAFSQAPLGTGTTRVIIAVYTESNEIKYLVDSKLPPGLIEVVTQFAPLPPLLPQAWQVSPDEIPENPGATSADTDSDTVSLPALTPEEGNEVDTWKVGTAIQLKATGNTYYELLRAKVVFLNNAPKVMLVVATMRYHKGASNLAETVWSDAAVNTATDLQTARKAEFAVLVSSIASILEAKPLRMKADARHPSWNHSEVVGAFATPPPFTIYTVAQDVLQSSMVEGESYAYSAGVLVSPFADSEMLAKYFEPESQDGDVVKHYGLQIGDMVKYLDKPWTVSGVGKNTGMILLHPFGFYRAGDDEAITVPPQYVVLYKSVEGNAQDSLINDWGNAAAVATDTYGFATGKMLSINVDAETTLPLPAGHTYHSAYSSPDKVGQILILSSQDSAFGKRGTALLVPVADVAEYFSDFHPELKVVTALLAAPSAGSLWVSTDPSTVGRVYLIVESSSSEVTALRRDPLNSSPEFYIKATYELVDWNSLANVLTKVSDRPTGNAVFATWFGEPTNIVPPDSNAPPLSTAVQLGNQTVTIRGYVEYGDNWYALFQDPEYAPAAQVPKTIELSELLEGLQSVDSGYETPTKPGLELSGTKPAQELAYKLGFRPITVGQLHKWMGIAVNLGYRYELTASEDLTITETVILHGIARDMNAGTTKASYQALYVGKNGLVWDYLHSFLAKYTPQSKVTSIVAALEPVLGEDGKTSASSASGSIASDSKFPKLNYKLSGETIFYLQGSGMIFIPSPTSVEFHIGSKLRTHKDYTLRLQNAAAGAKVALKKVTTNKADEYKLRGWTKDSENNDAPSAVIQNLKTKSWTVVPSSLALKAFFESVPLATTGMVEGAVVFAKGSEISAFGAAYDTGLSTVDNQLGWKIEQPAMLPLAHTHVSAGVIAIVPPTHIALSTDNGGTYYVERSIVLFKPIGDFGGYSLAIPKGRVEPGESIEDTAVRECFEETGVVAKLMNHLGDYTTSTGTTRLFIAHAVGGDPHAQQQEPPESAATIFAKFPLDEGDLKAQPWFKELGKGWQQKAVLDAHMHLNETNFGMFTPHSNAEPLGHVGAGTQVTIPTAATPKDIPAHVEPLVAIPTEPAVWDDVLLKFPYPVTNEMLASLKKGIAPLIPHALEGREKFQTPPSAWSTPGSGSKFIPAYSHGREMTWEEQPGIYQGIVQTVAFTDYLGWHQAKILGFFFTTNTDLAAGSGSKFIPAKIGEMVAGLTPVMGGVLNSTIAPEGLVHFAHSDPLVNAGLQAVYKANGKPTKAGCTLPKARKWVGEAGVPAWSAVSKENIKDVTSMFVPGKCPTWKMLLIVAALEARKAAQQSKTKKKDGKGVKPKIGIPDLEFNNPVLLNAVQMPQPLMFKDTGKMMKGGSKPNKILKGPGGHWLFKYPETASEEFRGYIDSAAYKLLSQVKNPGEVVPVGVMTFGGIVGSFQHIVPGVSDVKVAVHDLNEKNMRVLLTQHAFDMYVGDHDGHKGNWLMKGGNLIAIDKGQSFKFLLQGKSESLDPTWEAPGNHGKGYAKALLIAWGKHELEIPDAVFASMLTVIRKLAAFGVVELSDLLESDPEKMAGSVEKANALLKALADRGKKYEQDWLKVLNNLRTGFTWPAGVEQAIKPAKIFRATPETVGLTAETATDIEFAALSGWQGKALRIDREVFENQEVMVRGVLLRTGKGTETVPATLIHFRTSREAGLRIANTLYAQAGIDTSAAKIGEPIANQLSVDVKLSLFLTLRKAIGNINHHLAVQEDTDLDHTGRIAAALALEPVLKNLMSETEHATGVYADTQESTAAVFTMATQYYQYVLVLKDILADTTAHIGKHSIMFVPFEWKPSIEQAEAAVKVQKPYKIMLRSGGATMPTSKQLVAGITVVNSDYAVYSAGSQSQFVLHDPVSNAHLFWMPPKSAGISGVQAGISAFGGLGWAIIPAAPTPATVAKLLGIFADAAEVKLPQATKRDSDFLMLMKQAVGAQKKITSSTTGVASDAVPDLAHALELYRKGKDSDAETRAWAVLMEQTGKSKEELLADPAMQGTVNARGGGYNRQLRIGWDVKKLVKTLGAGVYFTHGLRVGIIEFFTQLAPHAPALLAQNLRRFMGAVDTGGSLQKDATTGGGQGVFGCLRKWPMKQSGALAFHPSMLLRLDVYQVGTGDTYGDTELQRYQTPDSWSLDQRHLDAITPGNARQINVRHDIDLQEYLVFARCSTETQRQTLIETAKVHGWVFKHGPPEKIFIV